MQREIKMDAVKEMYRGNKNEKKKRKKYFWRK